MRRRTPIFALILLSTFCLWKGKASNGTACSPDDIEEACLKYYSSPKSWSPKFDLQDTISSYMMNHMGRETTFPMSERTQAGIKMIPGLEVRIAKKPGCIFMGELMLSTSAKCEISSKSPTHVEEFETWKANTLKFLLSLPDESTLLFEGNLDQKFVDLQPSKIALTLFFCVKVDPLEKFKALHAIQFSQNTAFDDSAIAGEGWRSENRIESSRVPDTGGAFTAPDYSYTIMHYQAI
mmetsp:Transcript_19064/g.30992  ORF Transcript_19064/g.30992 Transcript_19064/m.30992 type:complete len:237 (-) Transcript_19064:73-783(-)